MIEQERESTSVVLGHLLTSIRPHETNKPSGEHFVKLALSTVVRELFDFIRL
jgi:hypothetical protein